MIRSHRAIPAVLVALVTLLPAVPARSHSVTVDGNASDWLPLTPSAGNLGRMVRGAPGLGEYVWFDVAGDERTDFSAPDAGVDIANLRVTGDPTGLSFLITMSDITMTSGFGAPMVQVSIDLDRSLGSGQTALAGFADTQVLPDAAWEYLVHTRFGNGMNVVRTLDAAFIPQGSDPAAIDPATNQIEFRVPWVRLGLGGPPPDAIRFTVTTYRSGVGDDTQDAGGPGMSNALDAVTNYLDPRTSGYPNTFNEVGDGTVHYAFDVWFQGSGEVVSPMLISEAMVDPFGPEPAGEWIELVNHMPVPVSLKDWRIGDEEMADGSEATGTFPALFVPPGQPIVVASNANAFLAEFGMLPAVEATNSDPTVPDLSPTPLWSTMGPVFQLTNVGDEILVLDRWFTVMDVLRWGSGVFPGVPGRPYTPEGVSHQRTPYDQDTDNCAADFADQPAPNPGTFGNPQTDITVSGLVVPAVRHGCRPFAVQASVSAASVATGAFRVGVYLSNDASVDLTDMPLSWQTLSLAAGETVPVSLSAEIPSGYTGTLHLGVIVDDLAQVAESDEGNNVVSTALAVPAAEIAAVTDVRNDQGRSVRVRWLASSLDDEAAGSTILSYEIYRRIDPLPAPGAAAPRGAGPLGAQLAGWDYVGQAPAHAESEYSMVVPTLADSNASGANASVFLVRATTSMPAVFYDSCPEYGWSVDNLAPAAPSPLTGTWASGATALHWGASPEADLAFYRVYRGTTAGFVPGPATLVSEQPDTGYVHPGSPGWFKVSAVDFNGNESAYAVLAPTAVAGAGGALPHVLALSAPRPNPARGAVAFTLALPQAAAVRATVLDAAGRRVHTLADGDLAAGEHALAWNLRDDRGRRVASGRYFLRVTAGGHDLVRSVAVLD